MRSLPPTNERVVSSTTRPGAKTGWRTDDDAVGASLLRLQELSLHLRGTRAASTPALFSTSTGQETLKRQKTFACIIGPCETCRFVNGSSAGGGSRSWRGNSASRRRRDSETTRCTDAALPHGELSGSARAKQRERGAPGAKLAGPTVEVDRREPTGAGVEQPAQLIVLRSVRHLARCFGVAHGIAVIAPLPSRPHLASQRETHMSLSRDLTSRLRCGARGGR